MWFFGNMRKRKVHDGKLLESYEYLIMLAYHSVYRVKTSSKPVDK